MFSRKLANSISATKLDSDLGSRGTTLAAFDVDKDKAHLVLSESIVPGFVSILDPSTYVVSPLHHSSVHITSHLSSVHIGTGIRSCI